MRFPSSLSRPNFVGKKKSPDNEKSTEDLRLDFGRRFDFDRHRRRLHPIWSGPDTEEGFIQALKYGRKPNDEPLRYPMRPHTAMTDTEVKAIFAYLKSLPPIHNPIAGK